MMRAESLFGLRLVQVTTWRPARAMAIGIGSMFWMPMGCMKTATVSDAVGGRSSSPSSTMMLSAPP